MEIRALCRSEIGEIAGLAAAFRVTLRSLKGIQSEPDFSGAKEELEGYFDASYPVYGAIADGEYIGYAVCRVDASRVWLESLFVDPAHRRKGVASGLFAKAEALAMEYGEDTVYNYVHPNNERMLSFLRAHGYSVLNLIEVRRPYAGEKLTTQIQVNDTLFDY